MFTLISATNPIYKSEDQQQINLTVEFAEFPNEPMQFNATSFDTEPHGVDLYNRAKAGEFGEVGAYVAPVITQPNTTGTQSA